MNKANSLPIAILLTGLIAGTLDATAAILNFIISTHKNPAVIFQYIASGVFGPKAFSGDSYIVIGILFHYLIAYLFTAFFFLIYPYIGGIAKNKVLTAVIYGVFVWLVMNFIVVPLSDVPKSPFNAKGVILGIAFLIVCIGLPNAFMAGRFYNRRGFEEV